jgi:hypothetical protein
MQVQGPQSPYEVFCPQCRVTFPVGTRHCLHCGGRLAQDRGRPVAAPSSFGERDTSVEDEAPRMGRFSPIALIWVLLFVVGTIYRACTSG